MGYPTVDQFDIKFIERTKNNVLGYDFPNKFTHLINSLVGLIFIPNEFYKKKKKTYKIDFLNKSISEYQELIDIFSGDVNLINEQGQLFKQLKFYRKDNNNNPILIENTKVGELVRLFRNGIAHSNITPVAEGDKWKGIIVKNFPTSKKEKQNDFNFETYLNQKDLKSFALFIANEYLKNVNRI